MSKLIYAVIGVGAIGLSVASSMWFGSDPPPAAFVPVPESAQAPLQESYTVYVSGAVVNPGLVAVPPGSRVADVVAAAGGARPDAESAVLNYAAQVHDGQQVHVPERGIGPVPSSPPGRISINSASLSELQTLPGVGPVLAQRIVEFRDVNGPFGAVEDLLDVPGIGDAKS